MSIVFDHKDIGKRYHDLTDGWIPREPVVACKSTEAEIDVYGLSVSLAPRLVPMGDDINPYQEQ